eukprot:1157840-Pelagomonas_calceolata.AAC.8
MQAESTISLMALLGSWARGRPPMAGAKSKYILDQLVAFKWLRQFLRWFEQTAPSPSSPQNTHTCMHPHTRRGDAELSIPSKMKWTRGYRTVTLQEDVRSRKHLQYLSLADENINGSPGSDKHSYFQRRDTGSYNRKQCRQLLPLVA